MCSDVPVQATRRCYRLAVHSSRGRPRPRLRRQFQVAFAAVMVAVLAAAVMVARHSIEPGRGGAGNAGSAGGRPYPSSTRPTTPSGPISGGTGSPLSPGWRGNGHAVTLAFGGDVDFEGPPAVRLAGDPAPALRRRPSPPIPGARLSVTNIEVA